ncbi:MAG: DUF5681 domain-containing protein [Brevundimonas sp.]|jgi:hypothetical protein|nr:DUF5681 domain-containing protein [Brevundimonas sp.]
MTRRTDYEVGYGKPPRHTRFKKGQPSPNPSGRPKREPTFIEEFEEELNALVEIQEGGRRRRYTKRRLIAKQMVNLAVKGDRTSLRLVQAIMTAIDAKAIEATEPMSDKERAAIDRAIFDTFAAMLETEKVEGPKVHEGEP